MYFEFNVRVVRDRRAKVLLRFTGGARVIKYFMGFWALLLMACQPTAKVNEESSHVEVQIDVSADHLTAIWKLPEPTQEFVFDPDAMPAEQRLAEWTLLEPGFSFDGLQLRSASGATFDEFVFEIQPATKFYDRKYVPVEKIGEDGWQILSGALSPENEPFRIAFSIADRASSLYANGQQFELNASLEGGNSGMIFVGSKEYVKTGSGTMITGNTVPSWISDHVSKALERATELYTDRLGIEPTTPPTVTISYEPDWPGRSYKGSVNRNVISLHFRGADYEAPDDSFAAFLENLVLHEAFHVWNGTMFKSSENAEQPWVHEGSAEYVASRMTSDDEALSQAATKAYNQCRIALGANSLLDTHSARRGRTPYDCGYFIHLVAEVAALKNSDVDILQIWSEVLKEAAQNGDEYDSDMFLEVVQQYSGEGAIRPISRILNGLDTDALPEFAGELRLLGILLEPVEESAANAYGRELSRTVLMRILLGYCEGGHGFWSNDDHYKLNTGDQCGEVFAGDPEVIELNGYSLITQPLEVYLSAKEACEQNYPIVFAKRDGTKLEKVDCVDPLRALPELYLVSLLEPLAEL